ncbi:MAG: hypothetical protein FWG85_07390 [Bacteroidetes bacterium]|nr:hypothetical protein [Bacteroidota bacterium]
METLELEMPKTKYIDLNQYQTIPALDRAIAELEAGEYVTYNSFEEYLEDMYRDDDEI